MVLGGTRNHNPVISWLTPKPSFLGAQNEDSFEPNAFIADENKEKGKMSLVEKSDKRGEE